MVTTLRSSAPPGRASLTTLTTTGYGDIVPVDPFARSLANLESVIGQFYLAIPVARLVTLELETKLWNWKLIPSIYPCAAKPGVPQCCDFLSFSSLRA